MNVKKKLVSGAMAATMGLSLVGGGTFAAFNDVENVDASIAAGELNLDLSSYDGPIDFQVSDLKPGDTMTRYINLKNTGSLAIKDVLMSVDSASFEDYNPGEGDSDIYGENSKLDYLEQFKVSVVKVGEEGGPSDFPKDIIEGNITLADFYRASSLTNVSDTERTDARDNLAAAINEEYYTDSRMNVATVNPDEWTGLPLIPNDDDKLRIDIAYVNDTDTDDNGVMLQNKFQGDEAGVTLTFEARQWDGQEITEDDMDGDYVESNEEANNGDPIE